MLYQIKGLCQAPGLLGLSCFHYTSVLITTGSKYASLDDPTVSNLQMGIFTRAWGQQQQRARLYPPYCNDCYTI